MINSFTKPTKIAVPERLIYKQPVRLEYDDVAPIANFDAYEYRMCDTKTGKYLGKMIAGPMICGKNSREYFYPIDQNYKSFFINQLYSKYANSGIGTDFINLAKNESRNQGCLGRVYLVASSLFNPSKPPHVFYRKLGFTSNNSKLNKYIDKCIKRKKNAHWMRVGDLCMYLPTDIKSSEKTVLNWNSIKKFFKNIF